MTPYQRNYDEDIHKALFENTYSTKQVVNFTNYSNLKANRASMMVKFPGELSGEIYPIQT